MAPPPGESVATPIEPESRASSIPNVTANAPTVPIFKESPPPPPPIRASKPINFEELVSGRGLAWTGGLAILIGAIFFLSLAFSRGWIGPEERVVIGCLSAEIMLIVGGWLFHRREAILGHVLVATGLGVMSLSLMAATRLYDLISIEVGLAAALVTAVITAIIAIRENLQIVAAYAVISALAAPLVIDSPANGVTIAFLAVALIGVTIISLYRTWVWLPPLAFGLTVPQLWIWVATDDGQSVPVLMTGIWAFWLLFSVSTTGEHLRSPDVHMERVSEWLLVANAVVLLGTGAWVIDDRNAAGLGLFVAAVALVHLALGGYFLRRDGATSEFGAVGANFGILALALAVPAALDGGWIAIGWASLLAVMAWMNARTHVWWTLVWAVVFGSLATIHFVAVEFSLNGIDSVDRLGIPFVNENGIVLISLLLALGVAAHGWGRGELRCIAVSVAGFMVLYAMPFEVTGLSLVIAWLMVALAFGALQKWPPLQLVSGDAKPDADGSDSFVSIAGRYSLLSVQLVGWGLAAIYLWDELLPLESVNQIREATTAFLNVETLAAGLLIGAAIASKELALSREMRGWWFVAAMSIAVYLIPFEVGLGPTVVLWSALALLTLSFASREPADEVFYFVVEVAILTIAFVLTIAEVAPPTRLAVDSKTIIGHPPFLSWATAALFSIACVLSLTARRFRGRPGFEKSSFAAVALVVYALSIGVVDIFQAQAGSDAPLEELIARHEGRFANLASLKKQAQVALSILWACLGVGCFVFGVLKGRSPVRMIGLMLMGLATAKVFIYDLAALDASYRVLSFVGLGILLLASSYVYQRFVKQEESNDAATGLDLPRERRRPVAFFGVAC